MATVLSTRNFIHKRVEIVRREKAIRKNFELLAAKIDFGFLNGA